MFNDGNTLCSKAFISVAAQDKLLPLNLDLNIIVGFEKFKKCNFSLKQYEFISCCKNRETISRDTCMNLDYFH